MKRMFKNALCFLLTLSFLLIASCSVNTKNVQRYYLNYKYVLRDLGDLHGLPPTSKEVIDMNDGFTSYKHLFNLDESFINFQCKGTTYDNFYCEGTFVLKDKKGTTLIDIPSFNCEYTGAQGGLVIFKDDETKSLIGPIYVYTPYWCRWQFEYDVDNSGNKTKLTFEFWKNHYNDLPSFLTALNDE